MFLYDNIHSYFQVEGSRSLHGHGHVTVTVTVVVVIRRHSCLLAEKYFRCFVFNDHIDF